MDIESRYKQVFEEIDALVENRKKNQYFTSLGYTSNLDLLCDFDIERLNEAIKKFIPNVTLEEIEKKDVVSDIPEILNAIVYFCTKGMGGEVDISEVELIKEIFDVKPGMGGTAVQAALALAEMDFPTIVHLTDDSEDVCKLLVKPSVYTISQDGLTHTDQIKQSKEQEVHCIIQFKKGDVIQLKDKEIVIPSSNRLILTKVTVNSIVPFSNEYFAWIEDNAKKVTSNVLSSLNTIIDKEILNKRISYLKEHIKKYKEKNPNGIIFFEDAHYHSMEIRKICLEELYSHVDIVSLNEEEMEYTLDKMYGYKVDITDIVSCVKGLRYLKEKLEIKKGIIIHTKDYSMYIGEKLDVDIRKGLMLGNMLATSKAKNGWYGTKKQVEDVLKLGLSEQGVKNYNIVKENAENDVVLIPTKYIDKPKYTIGLGDSFVGGVQMCF